MIRTLDFFLDWKEAPRISKLLRIAMRQRLYASRLRTRKFFSS